MLKSELQMLSEPQIVWEVEFEPHHVLHTGPGCFPHRIDFLPLPERRIRDAWAQQSAGLLRILRLLLAPHHPRLVLYITQRPANRSHLQGHYLTSSTRDLSTRGIFRCLKCQAHHYPRKWFYLAIYQLLQNHFSKHRWCFLKEQDKYRKRQRCPDVQRLPRWIATKSLWFLSKIN